jgi:hypothetical protein
LITELDDIVSNIENPTTEESDRDKFISKLNIYGYKEDDIQQSALIYWRSYFEENLREILEDSFNIESHLLDAEILKKCFSEVFEEYKNRKKDLGVDDIMKYWSPL